MKNKFIKKKIKGITVDVRSKNSLYITIGDWVVYLDNSTKERIVNTWNKEKIVNTENKKEEIYNGFVL